MITVKQIKENYDKYLNLLTHYYLYCGNSLEDSKKAAIQELKIRLEK
jgi:hypothetical protein